MEAFNTKDIKLSSFNYEEYKQRSTYKFKDKKEARDCINTYKHLIDKYGLPTGSYPPGDPRVQQLACACKYLFG